MAHSFIKESLSGEMLDLSVYRKHIMVKKFPSILYPVVGDKSRC